jgi:NTP pyrophosphatase (non-canonical NTP hydrolase)
MTDKAKVTGARYTEDQTLELVEAYTAVETQEARDAVVSTYAAKFERPVASVRAKLASERVYVPKAKTTKSGDPIVRKDQLVAQIAHLMGESEEAVECLEKVTKPVLQKIITQLTSPWE